MSVTVIGDAFVDLIVPVGGIGKGGTYHRKMLISCGGVANVAIWISRLGGRSKFVGRIGDDVFGEYFKQCLRANNVRDLTIIDKENPTGICVSLSYGDGERTMIAYRGANDFLKEDDVSALTREIMDSKIVYFSGYSLLRQQTSRAVLYVVKKCQNSCEICFNPGAYNLIDRKYFLNIIKKFVDILIMNKDEASVIAGKSKISDIVEVVKKLANVVVVTLGENGCIVIRGAQKVRIQHEKIKALDTTGAGDVFAAGFIVGMLRGFDDISCAKLGNETALEFLKRKCGKLA